MRYILTITSLIALISSSYSETGMCLVVTSSSGIDREGSIRRIDLQDDYVINTSGTLGTGSYPRFSPDGNRFAYLTGTTVKICELDGTVSAQFSVAEDGALSFTSNGIYIGGANKIRRYSLSGTEEWSLDPQYHSRNNVYVSQNGKIGTGVENIGTWRTVIYDLENNVSRYVSNEQGCSACPSPDGTMFTQNRGSISGANVTGTSCHLFARVRNNDDNLTVAKELALESITGYSSSATPAWGWNRHMWSGNSNEWIILPVGRDDENSPSCRQLDATCEPWVFNINTNAAIKLASRTSDFWQPYDYYSGKCYNPNTVALSLSPTSLSFSADEGGSNPGSQTVAASTSYGSLEGVSVSEDSSWLTTSLSATSGSSITITNNVDISGMPAGTYSATVTVSSSNGGSRTYTVNVTVTTVPVFTSIEVSPPAAFIAPDEDITFSATALDQYGTPMVSQPSFTWSASDDQSINSSGEFSAGSSEGGPYTVTASASISETNKDGTANVYVKSSPDVHLKINCGDNAYDVSGWERDDNYVQGGNIWTNTNTISTSGVTNAAPADVYKSVVHTSPHKYEFPDIADGVYIVRLHLADAFGDRSMNYIVEGDTLIRNLDVVTDAGGENKALVKDMQTVVNDGNGLTVECFSSGDVFEGGIEILGIVTEQAPLTITSPNGNETFDVGDTMEITWSTTNANGSYVVQFSPDGGLSYLSLTEESGAGGGSFEWVIPATLNGPNGDVSTTSSSCKIKLYDYADGSIADVSDATFTIGASTVIARLNKAGVEPLKILQHADGRLSVAVLRAEPYSVRVLSLKGRTLGYVSGMGPAQVAVGKRALPSGVVVLDAVLGKAGIRRQLMLP